MLSLAALVAVVVATPHLVLAVVVVVLQLLQ
jgi:hypothetical protein